MLTQELVYETLRRAADEMPDSITRRLARNDIVRKSQGLNYLIDDPEIHKRIGHFPPGTLPYGPINRALRSDFRGIMHLFNGNPLIPFSSAVNAELGECLEKAILVQLAMQDATRSFLVGGAIEHDNERGANPHGYNLLFDGDTPLLVDVENPVQSAKGIVPYIVPVTGIENDVFMVPEECRLGRTYSIC